jgi:hypothetical protein
MDYQRAPKPPTALGHRLSHRATAPPTRQQREAAAKAVARKRTRAELAWIAWQKKAKASTT